MCDAYMLSQRNVVVRCPTLVSTTTQHDNGCCSLGHTFSLCTFNSGEFEGVTQTCCANGMFVVRCLALVSTTAQLYNWCCSLGHTFTHCARITLYYCTLILLSLHCAGVTFIFFILFPCEFNWFHQHTHNCLSGE